MRVAIIGAGIYGCHLATVLQEYGIELCVFEERESLFELASGNNQFRLHLGYHYARDYGTRQQSKVGFAKFLDRYREFTMPFINNLYIVPNYDSLIDFKTYLAIFRHEGFAFALRKPSEFPFLENTDGVVCVDERIILVTALKEFFYKKLRNVIQFNSTVSPKDLATLANKYDYVIDCTWGKLMQPKDVFYEVTHLGYYKTRPGINFNFGLTYVDGALCSLYPTEIAGRFTLSSVTFTPLFRSEKLEEANQFLGGVSKETLIANVKRMAAQIEKYFPNFNTMFELDGHQVSMKSKIKGVNDPRDCRIERHENIISVFSGKIDTLYVAEDYILNLLT